MCKYCQYIDGQAICAPLNAICNFCVFGDRKMYERAEAAVKATSLVKNVQVYGIEDSIKASKYPMSVNTDSCDGDITGTTRKLGRCVTGTGHDQFLTGIIVQFDLTFSIKAWTEAQRYHFFDFVSSQSTMHRIAKFDIAEQCNEYVHFGTISVVKGLLDIYNDDPTPDNYLRLLYNIPVGFRLTARMTTNYRQLKTIYKQRKNHRLPEWREFCKWCEGLPYFMELCIGREKE